jgi:hypothetical protein
MPKAVKVDKPKAKSKSIIRKVKPRVVKPVVPPKDQVPPSIQDDALTCKINIKYPTEIIHISNNPPMVVDSDTKVQYTHTTVISDALFSSCKSKNLHIFLENLTVEQISLFRKVLDGIKPTQSLKNVNILTYQQHKDIKNPPVKYVLPTNVHFRKITNLQASTHTDNRLISRSYSPNIGIVIMQWVPNIKDNNETLLSKSWWYALIISIPICASGRLQQSTGTCWCNTIINNLILVPEIREKIIKAIEHPKYDSLRNKKFSGIATANDLKDALFILFNNLLVRTDRAQPDDGNFIAHIAARIKSIITSDDASEKLYNDAKKAGEEAIFALGNGGSHTVVASVYKLILNFFIPGKTYVQERCCDVYNANIEVTRNEVFDKLYTELCLGGRCVAGSDAEKEFNRRLDAGFDDIPGPEIFELNINPRLDVETVVINNNFLTPIKEIPLQISSGGNDYKIVASFIGFNTNDSGHAIAGLRCNDISYIYDSNNYIAYSDWHKGDFSGYISKIGNAYGKLPPTAIGGPTYPFNYTLIYTKDISGFSLFGGKAKGKAKGKAGKVVKPKAKVVKPKAKVVKPKAKVVKPKAGKK